MSNVILSIDDHIDIIPDEYSLNDSTTYMGIIFGWAYERKHLSECIYDNKKYLDLYRSLLEQRITIEMFVVECLKGEVREEMFLEEIKEFISDYITTGIFYKQVCAYFNVKNVYSLPKDWGVCISFFCEIDEHFSDVICNY